MSCAAISRPKCLHKAVLIIRWLLGSNRFGKRLHFVTKGSSLLADDSSLLAGCQKAVSTVCFQGQQLTGKL